MKRFRPCRLFAGIILGATLATYSLAFLFVPSAIVHAAPADITGTVYQDFNSNGRKDDAASATFTNAPGTGSYTAAIDGGVGAVTVTAYDADGSIVATTVSAPDGTYTLSDPRLVLGQAYRVEFTSLPTNYQSGAVQNSNSGTTASNSSVQFVTGGAPHVDFGVNNPADFCQNNPLLAINCVRPYDQNTGQFNTSTTLYRLAYADGSNSITNEYAYDQTTPATLNLANQIGTTLGLAYNRQKQLLYASAYMKRHAGFGKGQDGIANTADDPGAIYVINPANGAILKTITVPNATSNQHKVTDYFEEGYQPNPGGTEGPAWDAVGKTALGGVAVSDDGTRLYVMNVENRTLYAYNLDPASGVPVSNANPTTADGAQAVPLNPPTSAGNTCPANDVRPFAVTYYHNQVYVGVVCSAETSSSVNDLFGYVYKVDPVTLAFDPTPFAFPLNYQRGYVDEAFKAPLAPSANWQPWSKTFKQVANIDPTSYVYPQPMLISLAFDARGMSIGLRDRAGDQGGKQIKANPANNIEYFTIPAGDTLRACTTAGGSWLLESAGQCNGVGPGLRPNFATAGPGGGEYFYRDEYGYTGTLNDPVNVAGYTATSRNHDEVSYGTVAQVPGFPDVVATAFDPIPIRNAGANLFNMGGLRWWNNTTGDMIKGYRIFDDPSRYAGAPQDNFGKANGLGAVLFLCDTAPVEIGNRIWRDDNRNGVQDPDEAPIAGVTVQLYAPDGTTLLATAQTDSAGRYLFSSDPRGYSKIGNQAPNDVSTPTSGGFTQDHQGGSASTPSAKYGILGLAVGAAGIQVRVSTSQPALAGLTLTTPNASANAQDQRDSDATLAGANAVINLDPLRVGQDNHTLDIGFFGAYSVGNRVWFDTNNNGSIDGGEIGIAGVTVSLFAVASLGNATPSLATVTTDANGYYRFDNLAAGRYRVVIDRTNFGAGKRLEGYFSSGPTSADPTTNRSDSDDNGLNDASPADNGLRSGVLVLGPGDKEPVGADEPDRPASYGAGATTGTDAADINSNLTVDFGLYRLEIGNLVWVDDNNDGVQQSTEPGVGGVRVDLLDPNGNPLLDSHGQPVSTLTDSNGNYRFTNLEPGTYRVRITPPAGYTSSTGNGSETGSAGLSDGIDNDDVGITTGAFIVSSAFTLTPGVSGAAFEQTVSMSTGTTANPTIDFGLVPPYSLGNRVWFDVNNNGQIDSGEQGVAGVTVSLLDGNGNPVLGAGGLPRTAATSAGGYYRFDDLAAGSYIVRVDATNFSVSGPLAGYQSSSVTSADPQGNPADSDDNGIDDPDAATNGVRSGVVTLGPGPNAPTGETDRSTVPGDSTDGRSNLTVDFGFYIRPTAITMLRLSAARDATGVVVRWTTAQELNTLGFHIYRSATGKRADAVRVTDVRIAARGTRGTGASYSWLDTSALPNTSYTYWLEESDLDGTLTSYGPARTTQVSARVFLTLTMR